MILHHLLIRILSVTFGVSMCWKIDFMSDVAKDPPGNGIGQPEENSLYLIFPGTKWCGSGNIAENPEDLGYFAQTDACCRDHDQCDDIIEAMESMHNLTNPSSYTRVHCSCDEKFYDCLHKSEDKAGEKIGNIYFNLLSTKCFREDYPIVGCKRQTKYPKRCVEYKLDESQRKIYQWFDVPIY